MSVEGVEQESADKGVQMLRDSNDGALSHFFPLKKEKSRCSTNLIKFQEKKTKFLKKRPPLYCVRKIAYSAYRIGEATTIALL